MQCYQLSRVWEWLRAVVLLTPDEQVQLMTCGGAYERWFGT
jgi:hypothetical protein